MTIKTTSNQTKNGEVLSKLVVGEDVTVTDNAHGSAGHFQLETAETKEEGGVTSESAEKLAASDKRLTDIEKMSDINTNLDQIAASGQKLIDATKDASGTGSLENDLHKISAAIESLVHRQSSASEDKTSILNVTIRSRLLTDARFTNELNNTKIFQDLVRKNASNTKVSVSVDCSDADKEAGITAYCNPSNDINNYDNRAANLFWNFGAYAGKITLDSQWIGNIIAANATVYANAGIQSGRIVARTAGHKAGEIHMAVSGNVLIKKTSSDPVVTRSDRKMVIVSSEPSVTYKYRLKEQPSEPIVPDTPAEPEQPTTPIEPVSPSVPDISVVPDTTDTTTPGTDTSGKDTKVVTSSDSKRSSTPGAVITLTDSTAPEKEGATNEDGSYTEELPPLVLGEVRPNEGSGDSGEEPATKSNIQKRSPQTGDKSHMALWGSLAAASLCALGFTMAMQKGER